MTKSVQWSPEIQEFHDLLKAMLMQELQQYTVMRGEKADAFEAKMRKKYNFPEMRI